MTTMFILVDPHNRWSIVDDLPRPLDAAIKRRDQLRAGNHIWPMLDPVPHVHPVEEEQTLCLVYDWDSQAILFDGEATPTMRWALVDRWQQTWPTRRIGCDFDI